MSSEDHGQAIAETIRTQVEAVLGQAQARAAEIESEAREDAKRIQARAQQEAREEGRELLERARRQAEADAATLLAQAKEEAAEMRRGAAREAAETADRARSRLLRHAAEAERELDALITGLQRDAEALEARPGYER